MKYLRLATAALICTSTLSSCFKAEPLNAECDIEQAYVHTDNPLEVFLNLNDTLVNVIPNISVIDFAVRKNVDLTSITPYFKLTEGATISPASGVAQDFSHGPIVYTTTSQDGQYHRTYQVSIAADSLHTEYNFENFDLDEDEYYYVWNDLDENGKELNNWATGNPGFLLTDDEALPEDYPTVPCNDGENHTTCVQLTTRATGVFGSSVHMPIAAGNIFLGKFNLTKAMMPNAEGVRGVLATEFGLPFTAQPLQFSGWYKYQRGEQYQDKDENIISGKLDYGSIYAVFYDNTTADGSPFVLHGDDVLTSSQVVAIANLGKIDNTEDWTYFNINFDILDGKSISKEKLAARGYNLAIVCSSSTDGAMFQGAVGSTLWIDDFSIKCAE